MFNNYRPISILPVVSKVVEQVISSQINDFFKINNLFYDSQCIYVFRPGHSTEYAAIEITDRIISAMDKNKIRPPPIESFRYLRSCNIIR